jgi:hypothetical protein
MIQFTKTDHFEKQVGNLRAGAAAISEKQPFAPADFSIPAAQSAQTYNDALLRWRDQNFSLWNRLVPTQNDEDMIIAYEGEALRRGNYQAAVSAVSPAFLTGTRRTYESSVYLGGMERAVPSLAAAEREKISRLSRQINEKSLDFLRESHVFEFLAVRGYTNYIDDGMALVHSIDPAVLTPELTPGILEGLIDLRQYGLREENPFERLVDQSCFVISEGIRKVGAGQALTGTGTADLILVFQEGAADIEFNLRLGKALLVWAEVSGNEDWSALGRSIILSCLSLEDSLGMVPSALVMNGEEAGEPAGNSAPRISSARLYRILRAGEYYPRAVGISGGTPGILAWTAAPEIFADQEGGVLDIAVTFPVGEAHHIMIRGVRPFAKIQLYGVDYRTDAQFERYDSSGWVYQAQEQILVLKMKHRTAVEHIRIFYRAERAISSESPPETALNIPVEPQGTPGEASGGNER